MRLVRRGGGRELPFGAIRAGLLLAVYCGAWPADAALFGPLKQLNTNAKFDKGDDYGPRIATDDQGNWVAVWASKDMLYYNMFESNIGTDDDIFVQRSSDNGKTWTAVAPLNNDAFGDAKQDTSPVVATDKNGMWLAVWNGTGGTTIPAIGVDGDLLIARSEDNGATWTDPAPFNTNAETDGPYDYDTSADLATDENGNWIAVWFSRHNFGGVGDDLDILTARSSDNGMTWSDPARLNNNAWGDSGNDRFPRIATDTQGNWVTVWESNDWLGGEKAPFDWDIMVSRSSENGALWSDPKRVNSDGAGDIVHDDRPSIATDRLGNWVTAWVSTKKTWSDTDIYVSRSTSNGVNWTVKVPLHASAATDKEDDQFPWVATDRQGTWAV
ncbi:MAG: exo-alpha-sialidase, partial [Candidatus Hydrogenedentes bacterium]|nr:exo-alpha-sialidase [Candidatus Hydrogenedentota bacterium]